MLDDELWVLIEPLPPPPNPRREQYPGRKPLDDRKVLTSILFVHRHPREMMPRRWAGDGCGHGRKSACGIACTKSCLRGFERLAIIHETFLEIACCIICWRNLRMT